ncbi:MAG: hypothetical protein ACLGP3_01730, partial [Acidobacteriota bacterium]
MKRNLSVTVALILFFTPFTLPAQRGRGAGGGGGARQGQGQGTMAPATQPEQRGDMDRARDRTQDQTRDPASRQTRGQTRDQAQDPIGQSPRTPLHQQATTQQQEQYRAWNTSMEQARAQARTMAQTARGRVVSVDELKAQHQQLREQIRTLEQNREQLHQGLTQEQQNAIQKRTQAMRRSQERIQNQVQEMERELSGPVVDSAHMAEQLRTTDREMAGY